jgi:hypothetical protein
MADVDAACSVCPRCVDRGLDVAAFDVERHRITRTVHDELFELGLSARTTNNALARSLQTRPPKVGIGTSVMTPARGCTARG